MRSICHTSSSKPWGLDCGHCGETEWGEKLKKLWLLCNRKDEGEIKTKKEFFVKGLTKNIFYASECF